MQHLGSATFRLLLALTVCTALSCREQTTAAEAVTPAAEPAAEAGPPVAKIDGQTVSLEELDDFIKDQLLIQETRGGRPDRLYELRAGALNDLISERLLEAEAKRRGVSPDEVIGLELEEVPIAEEEIAAFFESNQEQLEGRSLDEARDAIKSYLERERIPQILESMRSGAEVTVLLEPERVEVLADGPSLGPATAPVTIVEFSDFQCPFCARAIPIVKELRERYPEQVRIVFRHLPLDRIHPRARAAAEAAVCAHDQDAFWKFHDVVFENNRALTDEDLEGHAAEAGLDVALFQQCVSEGKFKAKVAADVDAARELGITGTPAFFVNGILLSGAKPVEEFVTVIDRELARAGAPAAQGS